MTTSDVRCSIAEEARLEGIKLKSKDDEKHLVAWGVGMVVGGWGANDVKLRRVVDIGRRRETAGDGGRRRKFTATSVCIERRDTSRRH